MPSWSQASTIAAALLLAGCLGERTGVGPAPPTTSAITTAAPADMAGRWALSAAAGGTCAMNLTASGNEGAIRPEGGCPGNFFTSRKWTFEGGALILRNHNNEPLGQLTMAAPGRFEGQATGGQPVSLAR